MESLRTYETGLGWWGGYEKEGRDKYLRHQGAIASDTGGDLEATESGGASGDDLREKVRTRGRGGGTWSCLVMAS